MLRAWCWWQLAVHACLRCKHRHQEIEFSRMCFNFSWVYFAHMRNFLLTCLVTVSDKHLLFYKTAWHQHSNERLWPDEKTSDVACLVPFKATLMALRARSGSFRISSEVWWRSNNCRSAWQPGNVMGLCPPVPNRCGSFVVHKAD